MTYTTFTPDPGAFVNGVSPLSAAVMNAFRTFCLAGWFDSLITSDGSGVLTVAGLTTGSSRIKLADPGTAQTLVTGNTITISAPWVKLNCAGNVSGIIMPLGSVSGQLVFVNNQSSAGSITFAVSGSNVRNGSNVVISIGRIMGMIYDGTGTVWHTFANP